MRRFKVKADFNPYMNEIGTWFFWAIVFDTKAEMYSWYEKYKRRIGESHPHSIDVVDFEAICMPHWVEGKTKSGDWEILKELGYVLFHKDQLGAGIVSHEMGHCAFWHERFVNKNLNAEFGEDAGDAEERFLYTLTALVSSFYRKAYKLKLIE